MPVSHVQLRLLAPTLIAHLDPSSTVISLSDMKLDWEDSYVRPDNVPDKALISESERSRLPNSTAHDEAGEPMQNTESPVQQEAQSVPLRVFLRLLTLSRKRNLDAMQIADA